MEKNNNLGVRITSLFLAAVTVAVTAGCSLNKRKSEEFVSTTSFVTTSSNTEENIEIEESSVLDSNKFTTIENRKDDPIYNSLVDSLEKNMKQFDKSTQEDLRELLDVMYSNVDYVNEILPLVGFPDATTLIKEKFIEPLGKVKFIDVKTPDDDDYYDELMKYGSSCYDEKEKGIHIFCEDTDQFKQILAEEVFHSGQTWQENCSDYSLYCLLGEGEANLLSWTLVYGCISNIPASFFYDDENEFLTNVGYGLGNGAHSLTTKYYMYLSTLLGNEVIEEYKKTLDNSILTDKLTETYGIDGEKFFNDIIDVIADGVNYIQHGREEQFVNCEKVFLSCMEQKVKKSNTKEDVAKILEIYRYTNIQFGYEYLVYDEDGNCKNKTAEKLNKQEIEDELFYKCQKFKILGNITNHKEKERDIFDAIINPPKNREENVYPMSILSSKISYDSKNDVLTVYGNNGSSYKHSLKNNEVILLNNEKVESRGNVKH